MTWKTLSCLLLSSMMLALAGCATNAQRQAQHISQNTQTAVTQYTACVTNVFNAPETQLIRLHVPLNIKDATLEQLTDPTKASDEEIKAIYMQHPKFQECRNTALQILSTTTPTIVSILIDEYQKTDQNLINLIQQKITWGEANQRQKELYAEATKEMTAATQQINANLQHSYEAEMAQRQAAANALMQYSQTQQMINALNRPVTTSCMGTGYAVNCTTY